MSNCYCMRWLQMSYRLAVIAMVAGLLAGCHRAHYRQQADREVYQTTAWATDDPRWQIPDFTIQPDPSSRMYDPSDPDYPPMPPDDPESHRYMHCVDCKRGWPCWHCYGNASWVENPGWEAYLPRNEKGEVVLDRQGAVQVALLHSVEYQSNLEDLYLAALDVTFERFRFDTQFFFTNNTAYEHRGRVRGGGASQSLFSVDSDLRARRLLATGGELIVGFANSLVWQFSGPDTYSANSLLSFSLVQPLLREAGRAVVLEHLTQSERSLLANLRQMEQYRRGFYAQIVAGRSPGPGPSRGRLSLGALSPSSPSASAGGFLGLLEEQVNIRNQQMNIAGLEDSLKQLEALYEANRVRDRFQVDLARQALYRAQIGLLSSLSAYEERLDGFKILLGLPPELPVRIEDPLLRRFDLIDPALSRDLDEADALLTILFNPQNEVPADWRARLTGTAQDAADWLERVRPDLEQLMAVAPGRRKDLQEMLQRAGAEVDPSLYDIQAFDARIARILRDFEAVGRALKKAQAALPAFPDPPPRPGPEVDPRDPRRQAWEAWHAELTRLAGDFAELLSNLSVIQARARLESVSLVRVDLRPEEAIKIARQNRPDWMNARAALVDEWRQIEIAANALRSDLNVQFSGDLGTVGDNPFRFSGSNGRLRVGVEFDAPLTRLAERNAYRETLINYQRARRAYYLFEDRVTQNVRSVLRSIRLSQLNFEIRRAAVRVAIDQVEVARLNLQRPPRVGERGSEASANVGRDLVEALSRLVEAQNAFLSAWVNYEAQRLNLDFELGTMRLDDQGMWIDPGPIDSSFARGEDLAPPLPPALPE